MQVLLLLGTVFTGKGDGKRFVSLPWVKKQIESQVGFTPYAGTLNLRLTGTSQKNRTMLQKAQHLVIKPKKGFCPGYLIRAQVGNVQVAVVIPEVPGYPSDTLEVIAPVCLREEFGLSDDSLVAVAFRL